MARLPMRIDNWRALSSATDLIHSHQCGYSTQPASGCRSVGTGCSFREGNVCSLLLSGRAPAMATIMQVSATLLQLLPGQRVCCFQQVVVEERALHDGADPPPSSRSGGAPILRRCVTFRLRYCTRRPRLNHYPAVLCRFWISALTCACLRQGAIPVEGAASGWWYRSAASISLWLRMVCLRCSSSHTNRCSERQGSNEADRHIHSVSVSAGSHQKGLQRCTCQISLVRCCLKLEQLGISSLPGE